VITLKRRASATLLALLFTIACKSGDPAPGPQATASAAPAPRVEQFGAALAPAATLPLSRVLGDAASYSNRMVTVEGKVRRNCTNKGCWMELAESIEADHQGCRVTFKDYGFFVPLDSAGSTARVQGVVETKVLEPGQVDHMESEGATFAKKEPDGSAREVHIVATGVELTRGT
jgi:hypothetical protein